MKKIELFTWFELVNIELKLFIIYLIWDNRPDLSRLPTISIIAAYKYNSIFLPWMSDLTVIASEVHLLHVKSWVIKPGSDISIGIGYIIVVYRIAKWCNDCHVWKSLVRSDWVEVSKRPYGLCALQRKVLQYSIQCSNFKRRWSR